MSLFSRLRQREAAGDEIRVAITGAGLIGSGIARQIQLTRAMRTALIVNRTPEHGVEAYRKAGLNPADVVVSDDIPTLAQAVRDGSPAVTRNIEALREIDALHVMVEVTGAVEYGARVALEAIAGGTHVVMMNAETDATVGCLLKRRADEAGVVYSNSDGDQPGVLMRMIEYVGGTGFEVVAAINCKGFMNIWATPDDIRPWAEKQNTSLPMTTAFTDGTKMNIENAVLANATGLIPEKRGMHGVESTLATAIDDCMNVFGKHGLVDYTLGGDFAGGVFVLGHADDPEMVQPLMQYLKMGAGPYYMFYRPYHLCHIETPLSVAEAVLDQTPTIAPLGQPVVEVVTVAKRDLEAGDTLDGIGGYTCFGEVDVAANTQGLLPIGLAGNVRLTQPVAKGEPIPISAVELDESSLLYQLYLQQQAMTSAPV
jgi:predicted homoserine dehydrogenase-like protein